MRLLSQTLVAAAVAGAVVGATALTGPTVAVAVEGKSAPAVSAPTSAVEDFAYPQADKIFKERGIKLKRGDGHIVLAECGSRPDLMEVWGRGMADVDKVGKGKFCFRITGKQGYLSLELPKVYGAMGNDYAVRVNMVTSNEEKSFDLDKNEWTAVGETADQQGRDFTLLEIVAKK